MINPKQRIKSPENHHVICIGKTKCTSEKGLLPAAVQEMSLRSYPEGTAGLVRIVFSLNQSGNLLQIFVGL